MTIGTVALGVVGSGVTLIDGVILSMVARTRDYASVHYEAQDRPMVAGRGYASVSTSRRRRDRQLGGALPHGDLPRPLAPGKTAGAEVDQRSFDTLPSLA